jgi:hypothetical protein
MMNAVLCCAYSMLAGEALGIRSTDVAALETKVVKQDG